MFVAFLVVLAFVGSGVAVYFLMDAPRKRALESLARVADERQELQRWADDLADQRRELEARSRGLAASAAALDRRVAEFEARAEAFGRRVISYDELAAENGILKADLRNMGLHAAQQDYRLAEADAAWAAVADHRDRLGRAYLGEVRAAVRRAVTPATYPANRQRLRQALEQLRGAGVAVTADEERQALGELHQQYERALWAAAEREEQARIRERMREEQRREREAQEAVEQAERERRAVAAALERALNDAASRHTEEVERLRAQLAEAEAKSRRAISIAEITRSGYVYVISNVGSFGRDVFKIGMTRRLQPQDRVDELGDASVPFPFDVHMMVTSEDAPKLERALHRAFHLRRVNRVNPRKEFFRATIGEIVQAVREHHGEVEYRADAEALEYLQSQTMSEADLAEVEETFERAEAAASAGPPGVADGEDD